MEVTGKDKEPGVCQGWLRGSQYTRVVTGLGCSSLAAEERLGRWGRRRAICHAEPPVTVGKMSPSTPPRLPQCWDPHHGSQFPAAPALWCLGRDQQ